MFTDFVSSQPTIDSSDLALTDLAQSLNNDSLRACYAL
jgi:hypothetical protein